MLKTRKKHNKRRSSTRKQKGGDEKQTLRDEIRKLIVTPEAKFVFPHKEWDTLFTTKKASWNRHHPFTEKILYSIAKSELLESKKFSSFEEFQTWVLTPGSLEKISNIRFLKAIYSFLKEVQISDIDPEELSELRAVLDYEREPQFRGEPVINEEGNPLNTVSVVTRIQRLLAKQKPLNEESIVWRGQQRSEILPESWFSCSKNLKISMGYGNIIFKIHLQPNVHMLDMYDFYKNYGITNPVKNIHRARAIMKNHSFLYETTDFSEYAEVLVEGGGTFYKNKEKTEPGFATNTITPDEINSILLNEYLEGKTVEDARNDYIKEGLRMNASLSPEDLAIDFDEFLSSMTNTSRYTFYETYYFPPEQPLPEKQWVSLSHLNIPNEQPFTRKMSRNADKIRNIGNAKTILDQPYPTNIYFLNK